MTFENKTKKTQLLTLTVFSGILISMLYITSAASIVAQVTLSDGDIILADGGAEQILKVDPSTGSQSVVSSGNLLNEPQDVAFDSSGILIVAGGSAGDIISVDPSTGTQDDISSGGSLDFPMSVAIDSAGDIIVLDVGTATILRVDPSSGAQTVITSSGLSVPNDIVLDANGDIILTDSGVPHIVKIDPTSGSQTLISDDASFGDLFGITIDGNGDLIVGNNDEIVKVDPSTGVVTTISSGGFLSEPLGVAIDANGDILVTGSLDANEDLALIKVDPSTGAQTVVTAADLFEGPVGIAIFSEPAGSGDTDEDGIFDEVDTQVSVFSDDFDDTPVGGETTGGITTRGDQILTVTEETDDGVRIVADVSGGAAQAMIHACGELDSSDLDPGDEMIVECGSVKVNVINGQVELTFGNIDGSQTTTTLSQGNQITFEQDTGTYTAPATNTETVVISTNGQTFPVEPGSAVSIPLQVARPDSDPGMKWKAVGPHPCKEPNTFNCVDEVMRDDNDYIRTKDLQKNKSDKQFYTLSDISDPLTSGGHVLRYTISEADIGTNPVQLDVILRQGQTVIATFHHENLPSTFTLVEQTLTSTQADSITDYSDLELTLDGFCDSSCKNGSGKKEKVQVSWIEFAIMATP